MSGSVTSRTAHFRGRRRSARSVPFLFGVARRTELPGPVLVRLLEDLGMTQAGARGLLDRMRRDGDLAARRAGRHALYRLDGEMAARFALIRSRPSGPPEWPGHFHALIYQVPEGERQFRDQLRRNALLIGFGLLTSGVLLSLSDRWGDLADVLAEAPAPARVYPVELRMAEDDAARAAREAWSLDDLDVTFRAHLAELARLVPEDGGAQPAAPPASGGEALRRFAEVVGPVLLDLMRAPALPAALQPEDWSLPALRQAVGRVQGVLYPPALAHVEQLLAAHDAAGSP